MVSQFKKTALKSKLLVKGVVSDSGERLLIFELNTYTPLLSLRTFPLAPKAFLFTHPWPFPARAQTPPVADWLE